MKKYRWALERTLDDVRKNYEISHDLDAKEQLFLYLKAKKSLKEMECVSFREGKKSRDPWKYVKAIRIYDSINTLLADAVATDFNGVMLNAVTDRENAAYSYFCFVIKNGDNIVMVSDRPNVNFLRKYCGRSHGKQMEGRIMKHMFPYEILGLEMTKHNVKMTSTELSDKAFIGSTISQINPFSGFWVACCLSLLQDMFMGGQMDGAPHVYSGGMVSVPLDSHVSLPQPVDGDASLALRDAFGTLSETWIGMEDVKKTPTAGRGEILHHQNDWLVERYGNNINEACLNTTGESEMDKDGYPALLCFGSENVGTIDQIRNTRLFVARSNMAELISKYYENEVDDSMDSLRQYYLEKLETRKDFIKKTAVEKGEIVLTKHLWEKLKDEYVETYKNGGEIPFIGGTESFTPSFDQKRPENCLVAVREGKYVSQYLNASNATILTQKGKDGRLSRSWLTGGPISYVLKISINCPETIAEILGMETDELIPLLRHYTPMEKVGEGNPLINDLDPVEHIPNYICKFNADIVIGVSKREAGEALKVLVEE